jgi:hypothetical protein
MRVGDVLQSILRVEAGRTELSKAPVILPLSCLNLKSFVAGQDHDSDAKLKLTVMTRLALFCSS